MGVIVYVCVQIYPDFSAQREMRQFLVYCMFKMHGCRQTMPWSQYKVKFSISHMHIVTAILFVFEVVLWYRDGAGNATEENYSVFFLIRMC